MRLLDEVPSWIKFSMRLLIYPVALYFLYALGSGVAQMRIAGNVRECLKGATPTARGEALASAKRLSGCIEQKNTVVENFVMRPHRRAIEAMPRNPSEFVGVWKSSQPGCEYRFVLKADGQFSSRPVSCAISVETYAGYWGVFEGKMVWLYEQGHVWPPDINAMDVVDKDFFLLTERNGSRTKFTRAQDVTVAEKAMLTAGTGNSAAAATPAVAAPPSVPPVSESPLVLGDSPTRWSDNRLKSMRPALDAEKFVRVELPSDPDWRQHVRPELVSALTKILAGNECTKSGFSIYSKPGKAVRAIVGTDCEAREAGHVLSDYPLVIAVTDTEVRRIDLSRQEFMYRSGTIEAFTDTDNNGLIEVWLTGAICECDGEGTEGETQDCNCQGTAVVEATRASGAEAAAASSGPSVPASAAVEKPPLRTMPPASAQTTSSI